MIGFRISGDAGVSCFTPHSKCRGRMTAKTAYYGCPMSPSFGDMGRQLCLALLLVPVLLSGCSRTPTYSGPPDTVIKVVMKKWAIEPSRITLPQGARVELVVSTADVEHGLGVRGLAINEPVQPGKPAVIRFLAQTPGTYPMRCSILCGKGHKDMLGEIVIEPRPGAPPKSGT